MKLKIGILIIIAATATAIILSVNRIPDPFPQHMIGVWHSDAPGYEDRYFELTDAIMVFGQGQRRLNIQFISRVKAKQLKGGRTRYTIHHKDSYGFEQKTVFLFEKGDVGRLWFNHQENVVWQKFQLS
jgi:hypothetical protein